MQVASRLAIYANPAGHGNGHAGHVYGAGNGAAPSSVQLVVNGRTFDLATIGQMKRWSLAELNADLRQAGVSAPLANVILG